MKRIVLVFLDKLCWILDNVPGRWEGTWYRYGQWGCHPFRVSEFADWLEGRWKTGIWDPSPIPLDD